MRLKLYYTADEITSNLYTSGSQFMTEDNVEYRGTYHSYITGEVYTGSTWNAKTSKKLITFRDTSGKNAEYQQLKPTSLVFDKPNPTLVSITQQQINNKMVDRYFLKKVNETSIIEVDIAQYQKWISKQIDSVVYLGISIPWTIAGEIEDTIINGTLIKGVRTKNNLQIQYANSKLPGISDYLTNPLQYYLDTTFVIPQDINA
jgi:hypothetical protein